MPVRVCTDPEVFDRQRQVSAIVGRNGAVSAVSPAQFVDALAAEIERVRSDADFAARAKKLLERDREILDRLAK